MAEKGLMTLKSPLLPRLTFIATLVFSGLLCLPPAVRADAVEDYHAYLQTIKEIQERARAKANEALGGELNFKDAGDKIRAKEYIEEHPGQFEEFKDRALKAVEKVMPTTKELQKRRKEILGKLQSGDKDGADLSRDETWIVTQFNPFPSKEEKEILKKANVSGPTAEEFINQLETGVRGLMDDLGKPPKDKTSKDEKPEDGLTAEEFIKELEEGAQEVEDWIDFATFMETGRAPKSKKQIQEEKKKREAEQKKAEEARKKEEADAKKKKEQEEALKRLIEKRKKEEEGKKKTEGGDKPVEDGLTKEQEKIKNELEEALKKEPDKISKEDKDLLGTVLNDKDLMDLFFPDGVPQNPGGKSSKEIEAEKNKGAKSASTGAGGGFDSFDQVGSGVGGMLGGGGGFGGASGPSARDMGQMGGQPGGTTQMGGTGGEGHTHVYVGGVARDG